MTSKTNNQNFGIPAPVTKLTMEQDLKLRVLNDRLEDSYHDMKNEFSTLLIALQHQNFVLSNSLTNLVNQWPKPPMDQTTTNEVLPMFGILLETKD